MAKQKQKYYVVWEGRQRGIFLTWDECRAQVNGAAGARYKSFPTREEAEQAFSQGAPERKQPVQPVGKETAANQRLKKGELQNPPDYRHDTVLPLPPEVTADALAVDAACSGNPGQMEYQGIDLATGARVFHFGPVWGTNNIGEFLAIVHALAWLKQRGMSKTVYTDSRNALLWVKAKKCRTKLQPSARTAELFGVIARAEAWLQNNSIDVPLLKWKTGQWGEIPADFGRKH